MDLATVMCIIIVTIIKEGKSGEYSTSGGGFNFKN